MGRKKIEVKAERRTFTFSRETFLRMKDYQEKTGIRSFSNACEILIKYALDKLL